MKQQDLADKLGLVRSAIANYETGRAVPDSETLSLIANIFNVTTDYLLGRSTYRDGTLVDTREKAEKVTYDIIQLLIDSGEFTEEEIKSGKLDDEKRKRVISKVRKAIKFAQELDKM